MAVRQSARPAAGGVFISYRRDESTAYAHLLHYLLSDRLGKVPVFMDVHTIGPGEDFVAEIEQAVANCLVLLVLIGPGWTSLRGGDGRSRLDDPEDFVRIEVETALRDPGKPLVIPVLVEQARMPRAEEVPAGLADLCRRQALALGQTSFQHDLRSLVATVERAVGIEPYPPGRSPTKPVDPAEPADLVITRIAPVKRWKYQWPDTSVERYHTTTGYTVVDDQGELGVLVARGDRWAFARERGRIVVFGNSGGASSEYYPWTEFVETDDGEYAAKLYNPVDHRKSLRDGDPLPPRFAQAQVRRTDAVLRSVRNGPSLRLVVGKDDESAMIRHGHWAARLRQTV